MTKKTNYKLTKTDIESIKEKIQKLKEEISEELASSTYDKVATRIEDFDHGLFQQSNQRIQVLYSILDTYRRMLSNPEIVEFHQEEENNLEIGDTVFLQFEEEGEILYHSYDFVTNPDQDKAISINSPLGELILGKKENDTVFYNERKITILKIFKSSLGKKKILNEVANYRAILVGEYTLLNPKSSTRKKADVFGVSNYTISQDINKTFATLEPEKYAVIMANIEEANRYRTARIIAERNLYLDEGMTITEIASLTGETESMVYRNLTEYLEKISPEYEEDCKKIKDQMKENHLGSSSQIEKKNHHE